MKRLLLETRRNASFEGVRELRELLEKLTNLIHLSKNTAFQMTLCLAEAANNIVEHSSPAASYCALKFGSTAEGWWLELEDDGGAWDSSVMAAEAIEIENSESHTGRGLMLLKLSCDQCYFEREKGINRCYLYWHTEITQRRKTVLLVDDDKALRSLYKAYLSADYQLFIAENGTQALSILKRESIDLVISDIEMPDMSGLKLREALLSIPELEITPFIFLTGKSSSEVSSCANGLGIDDYLIKPVNKERLLVSTERVIRRHEQLCSRIRDQLDSNIIDSLKQETPVLSGGWKLYSEQRNAGRGGGDMLIHQTIPNGHRILLLDVMGHNETSKFFAFAYTGYLRGLMSACQGIDLARLMSCLSDALCEDQLLSQSMLTCLAVEINGAGKVQLVSAGHPPPFIVSAGGCLPLPVEGTLAGLYPGIEYATVDYQMQAGEKLVLYTDGLFDSDSQRADRGRLQQSLLDELRQKGDLAADLLLKKIFELFDLHTEYRPTDDAMLALLEFDCSH